jgi:hypothetical protein
MFAPFHCLSVLLALEVPPRMEMSAAKAEGGWSYRMFNHGQVAVFD